MHFAGIYRWDVQSSAASAASPGRQEAGGEEPGLPAKMATSILSQMSPKPLPSGGGVS